MRKIAIITSGCILLLGGLFYGWSFKNQPPSKVPAPEVSLLTQPGNATAILPAELSSKGASPIPASGNRPSGQTDPENGTGEAGVKPRQPQTSLTEEPNRRSSIDRTSSNPEPMEDPVPLEPEQSQAPMGIRLAPNVRLPAAAMPLDFKVSPVAKKVLDQIVADYYREVALSPSSKDQYGNANPADSSTPDLIEKSETGELTRVITNGPAVDSARKRADARFKALFGFQAFNRMTMNTLLEARTPVPTEE